MYLCKQYKRGDIRVGKVDLRRVNKRNLIICM